MPRYSFASLVNLVVKFPIIAYLVGFFEDFVIATMKTGPIPKHIALIMDGNRTYAKNHGLPLKEGHFAGANALVKVLFLFLIILSIDFPSKSRLTGLILGT